MKKLLVMAGLLSVFTIDVSAKSSFQPCPKAGSRYVCGSDSLKTQNSAPRSSARTYTKEDKEGSWLVNPQDKTTQKIVNGVPTGPKYPWDVKKSENNSSRNPNTNSTIKPWYENCGSPTGPTGGC